ncbi:MAG: hypothetical protein OXN21_10630, partial [Chloroflexota bacterium]|nr:hypothetical protein [Chloroflexota bacterium]
GWVGGGLLVSLSSPRSAARRRWPAPRRRRPPPRRSLYDRLRAIAEYRHNRRPSVVLVLVPSPWEQRLTDEFCLNACIRDYYVAVENRDTLEAWDRTVWISSNCTFDKIYHTLEQVVSGPRQQEVPPGGAGAQAGYPARPGADGNGRCATGEMGYK